MLLEMVNTCKRCILRKYLPHQMLCLQKGVIILNDKSYQWLMISAIENAQLFFGLFQLYTHFNVNKDSEFIIPKAQEIYSKYGLTEKRAC